MKTYGLGLFIALPFCLELLSVLIYNSDSAIGVQAFSLRHKATRTQLERSS